MASTNKTTHYELSQYVGSDKPTYLTDYNNDMSAIDTGIYNAQDKANSAYTLAGTADGKADTAITNAGTAQTDASTALTRIGTMANLETTEKTNLVGAINEVDGLVKNFNLGVATVLENPTTSNITSIGIATNVNLAVNSEGSIFKLYGYISVDATTAGQNCSLTYSTSLRPDSEYNITNCIVACSNGNLVTSNINVKTNGNVTIEFYAIATSCTVVLPACIYFNKSLGDTPSA